MIDFDAITDDILVGTRFDANEWYKIEAEGVTCCINLMAEQRDHFPPQAQPSAALWLPVPDWQGPDVETLRLGVAVLRGMVGKGHRVYVHCLAGVGRSPTLTAAYLTHTTAMNASEALAFVREKRPATDPNRLQIRMLNEFTRSG